MTYTRNEQAAINAAFAAIEQLCDMSQGDENRLAQALKLERAQASPVQKQPVLWARARVVKYWHKGYTLANSLTLWNVCDNRPGVLGALTLGASHKRRIDAPSDARLRRTMHALRLAPDAIAAYEAEWNRVLDSI